MGELIPAEATEEIEDLTAGLTERAKLFVFEYAKDFNGTQAAIRAGYSKAGAHQQADVLLRNPTIRGAVKLATDCRLAAVNVSVDRIVREYARIAFLDPRQFYNDDGSLKDITGLPDEVSAAIAGIEIEHRHERGSSDDDGVDVTTKRVKLACKMSALKELSKLAVFAGAFKPSGEGSPGDTTNIQFNYNVTVAGH